MIEKEFSGLGTGVSYEWTDIVLKDKNGNEIFNRKCEFPTNWSYNARVITASKYFTNDEISLRQLIGRVVHTITQAGLDQGTLSNNAEDENYCDAFRDNLFHLLERQYASFNSPVWFNIGAQGRPQQASACFLLDVEDNMGSILDWIKTEATIFKGGSGSGVNISKLRANGEPIHPRGTSGGPLSFMAGADCMAGVIKSGSVARRAAKMVIMDVDHPDIIEFINCKKKAEDILRKFKDALGEEIDVNSELLSFIPYQNANNSVSVTDHFMECLESNFEYRLKYRTDENKIKFVKPKNIFREIAQAAWETGDPGIFYYDNSNKWHTCKETGPIITTNPCFRGDMYVDTDEGKLTFIELTKRFNTGQEMPYAFCWDTKNNRPSIRKIKRAGLTRYNAEIVKVTLKSPYKTKYLYCTPDHQFMTRSGEMQSVSQLLGKSVRTLYRTVDGQNHIFLQTPVGNFKEHRLVYSEVNNVNIATLDQIHHKDHNKHNNYHKNLEHLNERDHMEYHSQGNNNGRALNIDWNIAREVYFTLKENKPKKGVTPWRWNTYIKKHRLAGILPKVNYNAKTQFRWNEIVQKSEELGPLNHKIISIEPAGYADVYDIEVEDHHNFGVTDNNNKLDSSIIVSNCGEWQFLTWTPCNLASINLLKFLYFKENGKAVFRVEDFIKTVRIMITAMDILCEYSDYPIPKIKEEANKYRTLGLGYANLGALLMSLGLPYDSESGRFIARAITSLMTSVAYHQSSQLANISGPFPEFEKNRKSMLEVINKHLTFQKPLEKVNTAWVPLENIETIVGKAGLYWTILDPETVKYRNAQVTLLAPTGTISFMMDCDTTGIEPELSLIKHKTLVGGGNLKICNNNIKNALWSLGYNPQSTKAIQDYITEHNTVEGCPQLLQEHLPVFDCAFPGGGVRSIDPYGHLKMVAAVQPFLSSGISKTINMPSDCTVEDIENIYTLGWKMGVKAISIYRDGSKVAQPVKSQTKKETIKDIYSEGLTVGLELGKKLNTNHGQIELNLSSTPTRKRLPDTRISTTHKFDIAGHEGYITVGMYPDGKPGEVFITMSKEGSTISGLMDSFATSISLGLQYGVPLNSLVEKFKHTRFEPMGFTSNDDIKQTSSIIDYLFRWLELTFKEKELMYTNGHNTVEETISFTLFESTKSQLPFTGDTCIQCGGIMRQSGTCKTCVNCGENTGCS